MGKRVFTIIEKIVRTSLGIKRKYFVLLMVFNIVIVILSVISILNTQTIMNNVQLGVSFSSNEFLFPLLMYPLIIILSELLNQLTQYISLRYSDILNYKFSVLQLKVINKQNLETFENPQFYDLMQRAEYAGGIYPYKIMNSIIILVTQIVNSISFLIILTSWHWWAVLFIAVFPVLSGFQMVRLGISEYKIRYNRTTYERESWYYAQLLNKDINIKETKLFSLENIFLNKFKLVREKFLSENRQMYKKRSITTFIIQLLSILTTTIIVFLIFYDASKGLILLGSLMTYINAVSNTKNSFSMIFSTFFQLHQDVLHAGDIIDLIEYGEKKLPENNSLLKIDSIEKIAFRNVSFKYGNNGEYALNQINLEFKKGQNYIITGKNGSGKSTLVKLILGLYENYEGEILINGIDLKKIDKKVYKNLLSAIFQDFTKYQFKVKEAISISDYSRKNEIEKIVAAGKHANADFIEKLSDGFDQQVGSWFIGGKQLSGGEWQKLAIARAFFRSDTAVVVMDEPSASLDPISEYNVFENFRDLSKDKIGLFITHRLKNFDLQGEIIYIDQGEILEQGELDDLINSQGKFEKFYNFSGLFNEGN